MIGPIQIENEAFKIAQVYLQNIKRHTHKTFNLRNIKSSKTWPFFLRLAEQHMLKPEWDANKFIVFVFDQYGPIYPAQMKTQKIWEEFVGTTKFVNIESDKKIALELLNSYKVIRRWCNKYKEDFSVKKYIDQPKNRIFVKRGGLSPLFISICVPLLDFIYNLPEKDKDVIIGGSLENKRMVVFSNKKIVDKMKEVLKNEFY